MRVDPLRKAEKEFLERHHADPEYPVNDYLRAKVRGGQGPGFGVWKLLDELGYRGCGNNPILIANNVYRIGLDQALMETLSSERTMTGDSIGFHKRFKAIGWMERELEPHRDMLTDPTPFSREGSETDEELVVTLLTDYFGWDSDRIRATIDKRLYQVVDSKDENVSDVFAVYRPNHLTFEEDFIFLQDYRAQAIDFVVARVAERIRTSQELIRPFFERVVS